MPRVWATDPSDGIEELRSLNNTGSEICLLSAFFHTFLTYTVAVFFVCFPLKLKVTIPDKPGANVNFRKILLNRCQKEFEKDKDDDEIFEKKQKELEAAAGVKFLDYGLRVK